MTDHPALMRIAQNAGWLFADRAVRFGIGLVITALVARYLGPDQFGVLSYAMAFFAIFGIIATFGLDSIVIREIVRNPSSANEILGTASVMKVIGAFIALIGAVGAAALLHSQQSTTITLVAIIAGGTIFQSLDTIDFWFQAQLKAKYTVLARNLAFLTASAVRVVLILSHAPLISFAWPVLLEAAIAAIGLILWFKKDGNALSEWRFTLARAIWLLRESWTLIIQGLVIIVYMKIDQIMLGHMTTNKSLGEYSAAVRLVEMAYFIAVAISASLFPEIITSKKLSPDQYEGRIQRMYDFMIWMAIIPASIVTVSSPIIIRVLYGEAYQDAAMILSIQIWMITSVFFGVARQKWLTVEGHLKDAMYVELAGVVLNISANVVLIPKYGAIGASIASLIGAFGANLLAATFSFPIRKSLRMYGQSLFKPVQQIRLLLIRTPQ